MPDAGTPAPPEIASRVQAWLLDAEWTTDPITLPHLAWGFRAKNPKGTVVAVSQRADKRDLIVIEAALMFDATSQQRLRQMPPTERIALLRDVQLQLLHLGVMFDGISDPLERVLVLQHVYYDGLAKDTFVQRLFQVLRGLFLVDGLIARRFLDPLPPRSLESSVH
jgi:hypothetical protein